MFAYAPHVRRLRWYNLGADVGLLLVGTQLLFANAHLPSRWSSHAPPRSRCCCGPLWPRP